MPNTKLTKAAVKNHMHYGKAVYLLMAVVMWIVADLAYSITEYSSPNERKVDIEIVAAYVNTDGLAEVAAQALADGQAYETRVAEEKGEIPEEGFTPALEEVNILNITYDSESTDSDSYYGQQKFMVMLAAQEGDIYFVNKAVLEELMASGVPVPLEDYIASGVLDPGERDLSKVTYRETETLAGENYDVNKTHVYALQADTLYAMYGDDILLDVSDYYMIITCFSQNRDTTAAVLGSFMRQLETEKPEWLDAYLAAKDGTADATAEAQTE